jgi:hypothetical protein
MAEKKFVLAATIKSENPTAIEPILTKLFGVDALLRIDGGFQVRKTVEGRNAKDLNRTLLSELRRVEKKTTLRAEWGHAGTTEKFFDYVPKGVKKN